MEQIVYNILTYIIIGFALFVAGKKMYGKAFSKKKESGCGDGCGGCSSKCELKDLATNLNK